MAGGLILASASAAGCGAAASKRPAEDAASPGTGPVGAGPRWLVTFSEPAVAVRFAGSADTGSAGSRQERMQAYAAALRQAKEPRLQAIRALGAVVVNTLEYSSNAALIDIPAEQAAAVVESVRRIVGVSSVQRSGVYQADPGASQAPR